MLELTSDLERIEEAVRQRGTILACAIGTGEAVVLVECKRNMQFVVWSVNLADCITVQGDYFNWTLTLASDLASDSAAVKRLIQLRLAWERFIQRAPLKVR